MSLTPSLTPAIDGDGCAQAISHAAEPFLHKKPRRATPCRLPYFAQFWLLSKMPDRYCSDLRSIEGFVGRTVGKLFSRLPGVARRGFLCRNGRIVCIGVVPCSAPGPGSVCIGFLAGAAGRKRRASFSPVASRSMFHAKHAYVFTCSPRITLVVATILYKDSLKSLH